MLKGYYIWEFPVRLTHWVNAVCVVILCFTGYYIGHPYIHSVHPFFYGVSIKGQWIMGWMRLIHFITGYVFTMSVLYRVYWAFVGNRYARWRAVIPLKKKTWKKLWGYIKFYLLIEEEPPESGGGHSPLAGVAYFVLFLGFFVSILTGFALYSQSHSGFVRELMGGWVFSYAHPQYVRLIHHGLMWFLIVFPIAHKYIGWITDLQKQDGIMSSMFSGYKVHDLKNRTYRRR